MNQNSTVSSSDGQKSPNPYLKSISYRLHLGVKIAKKPPLGQKKSKTTTQLLIIYCVLFNHKNVSKTESDWSFPHRVLRSCVWIIIDRKVLILKLLRSFCYKVIETSLTYKFRRRLQIPLWSPSEFRRDLWRPAEVSWSKKTEKRNLWRNRKWRRQMSTHWP